MNSRFLPRKLRRQLESDYLHTALKSLAKEQRTDVVVKTVCETIQDWDDVRLINQCLSKNIPVVILPEIERISLPKI
jgi:uncharacterized membrane-anchored protein YjiN (DUF445 family)